MPVSTGWLCEDRVMVIRFEGVISDADMDVVDDFILRGYDNSPVPVVHVIADTRAITVHSSLRKTLRLKCMRHARRGLAITVGALKNPTSRFIVGALTSMFQLRHRDVEVPHDALDILRRMDPALPDLEPVRLDAFYPEMVP